MMSYLVTEGAQMTIPAALLVALAIMAPVAVAAVADQPSLTTHAAAPDRPRLLVLTDIGGDPDDQQSMIRLMLYTNEFEIEGLIASASGTPGELKERMTKPHLIREIIEAYGKVRQNLVKHAEGYPTAESLLAKVKSGNPNRGREAGGAGKDTDGSRQIIAAVESPDPRPLNISIWGGQTDLAQALWRVRKDRGADALARFLKRFRVYDIADQDKIVEWMWDEYPGMFYILANAPKGADKRLATFRGMYLGGDEALTSRDWIETNVRQKHGPLGALYPTKTWTAPNPHGVMKEGDTPSWFSFLPNGLSDPDHPEWGSWGGRFELDPKRGGGRSRIYRDAPDIVDGEKPDPRAAVWRWRPAFQADFQARLDWCVADERAKATHPPTLTVNGDAGRAPLMLEAAAEQEVKLTIEQAGSGAAAPALVRCFVYPEAGTFRGDAITIGVAPDGRTARFTVPGVAEPKTLHVVVEVQSGTQPTPAVYRRVVVTVQPRNV